MALVEVFSAVGKRYASCSAGLARRTFGTPPRSMRRRSEAAVALATLGYELVLAITKAIVTLLYKGSCPPAALVSGMHQDW